VLGAVLLTVGGFRLLSLSDRTESGPPDAGRSLARADAGLSVAAIPAAILSPVAIGPPVAPPARSDSPVERVEQPLARAENPDETREDADDELEKAEEPKKPEPIVASGVREKTSGDDVRLAAARKVLSQNDLVRSGKRYSLDEKAAIEQCNTASQVRQRWKQQVASFQRRRFKRCGGKSRPCSMA
jgi:hypothetical protein